MIQHYKAEPVVSIDKSGPIVLLTMNQGLQHVKYNVDQTLQTGSIKSIPQTEPIVSIFKQDLYYLPFQHRTNSILNIY